MKKLFGIAIALGLVVTSVGAYALSSDTMFLKTETAKECQTVGGTQTSFNAKDYCLNSPENVLTKSEQTKIGLGIKKLKKIITSDTSAYTKIMKTLEGYKSEFIQKKDSARLAITMFMTQNIKKDTVVSVPNTCSVWFDGCNTCQVGENGEMACTRMYCAEKEAPKCLENKAETKVPATCGVWFDGCNTCQVLDNGEMACTRMYCAEKKAPKCLENKAETKVPATCGVWFDGCNTCQVLDNGEMACTMMYCAEKEVAKCLKNK